MGERLDRLTMGKVLDCVQAMEDEQPKFSIGSVACPNCQDAGIVSRMLFHTMDFEGCAFGMEGEEVEHGLLGISIEAGVMCPVCKFETYVSISINFVEPTVGLDGKVVMQ